MDSSDEGGRRKALKKEDRDGDGVSFYETMMK